MSLKRGRENYDSRYASSIGKKSNEVPKMNFFSNIKSFRQLSIFIQRIKKRQRLLIEIVTTFIKSLLLEIESFWKKTSYQKLD